MATEVVKVVDPDNGTGTDYTSLNAWEAGEQKDLVSADEIAIAKCRCTGGSADTDAVVIDGWTTDADHYIKIWTDPSENYRHDGKWNDSKYRIVAYSDEGVIWNYEPYVRILGIQLQNTKTGNDSRAFNNSVYGTVGIYLGYLIVKAPSNITGSTPIGCYLAGAETSTIYLYNSLIYDFISSDGSGYGIHAATNQLTAYIYNVTVINCHIGIKGGSGAKERVKNCITQDCDDGFYSSFHSDSDYNISDTGDAPGPNSKNCTVSFVDKANDDFHLSSTDTCAKDSGVDLSSDPNLSFNDDIDGETRSGTWDIGADEYIPSGGQTYYQTVGGTLSFAGNVGTAVTFAVPVSGSLSFSGNISKTIKKQLQGGLNFIGGISRGIKKKLTGSLNFSGNLTTSTGLEQINQGTLTFSGSLTTHPIYRVLVGGTLSFTGSLKKLIKKTLKGTLSFFGQVITPFTKTVGKWILKYWRG